MFHPLTFVHYFSCTALFLSSVFQDNLFSFFYKYYFLISGRPELQRFHKSAWFRHFFSFYFSELSWFLCWLTWTYPHTFLELGLWLEWREFTLSVLVMLLVFFFFMTSGLCLVVLTAAILGTQKLSHTGYGWSLRKKLKLVKFFPTLPGKQNHRRPSLQTGLRSRTLHPPFNVRGIPHYVFISGSASGSSYTSHIGWLRFSLSLEDETPDHSSLFPFQWSLAHSNHLFCLLFCFFLFMWIFIFDSIFLFYSFCYIGSKERTLNCGTCNAI